MVSYGRIMIQTHFAKAKERGASAVEYGLLVAGIAAVIVVAVIALGGNVASVFSDTCSAVSTTENADPDACEGGDE